MGSSLKIKLQVAVQTQASEGKGVQYMNEPDYFAPLPEMNLYRHLPQASLAFLDYHSTVYYSSTKHDASENTS